MLRTVLLATLLASFGLALAPPPAAAQSETCSVALTTWTLTVSCSGVLYEFARLTWCPHVSDDITCLDRSILHCIVSTTRPFLVCPLA